MKQTLKAARIRAVSVKDELEAERMTLENEKLRIELDRIKNKWWKQPSNWVTTVTVLSSLTAVGVQYGLSTAKYEAAQVKADRAALDEEKAVKQREEAERQLLELDKRKQAMIAKADIVKGVLLKEVRILRSLLINAPLLKRQVDEITASLERASASVDEAASTTRPTK